MADVPTLSVTMLGAGQEVGRSCCVLQYRGRTIVCDTGIHPALSGIASLPFIDELDWSTVDAVLVTQWDIWAACSIKFIQALPSFHLDHAAALTFITEKVSKVNAIWSWPLAQDDFQTNFRDGKGKVYMTHPTKALHKFMMQDFVRTGWACSIFCCQNSANVVHSSSTSDALFSPLELSMSLSMITPVSVHQLITVCPGVTFTPYHAGHVLGACMFLIDIAGLKILYTGDYSREEDRHLVKAEIPTVRPDVLIVESTYGVQSLEDRPDKELRFTKLVHAIIKRGGHVLLPTFALGRAQELLLILDEYWRKNPDLHNVPIYYASALARKCMAVYQTYIHTMNNNIRSRFAKRDNPFVFKCDTHLLISTDTFWTVFRHVSNLPQPRGWEKKIAEGPPCVVLASPGFMQSGPSRELLEYWAPDSRNGLIVTGYSVEGTMARVSGIIAISLLAHLYVFGKRNVYFFAFLLLCASRKPVECELTYLSLYAHFFQDIMNEPDEIESIKGGMIPRKLSVEYISFSAHVDYSQNKEFIELIKAQHVVSCTVGVRL
jgi:cleavage and polyadenylation specificity factor subunit 3